MRTVRLLALSALLPSVLACASGRHASPGEAAAVAPDLPAAPMAVVVENHHFANVRIFVVHDGQTSRLGLVDAASTATFDLPPRLVGQMGEIRLVAYPIAAFAKLTSEPIVVKPGQQVSWTLESKLEKSSLAVF